MRQKRKAELMRESIEDNMRTLEIIAQAAGEASLKAMKDRYAKEAEDREIVFDLFCGLNFRSAMELDAMGSGWDERALMEIAEEFRERLVTLGVDDVPTPGELISYMKARL